MMSRYEERLERDLDDIRQRVVEIGDSVGVGLKRALHAVVTHNPDLGSQVILEDLPINRNVRELDRRCHAFVARHLPGAGHLRFVSSVLRINIALERIGDYAVTVSRELAQLSGPVPEDLARDVDLLGDQVRDMLAQSIKAFREDNAEMARGTKAMAAQVERSFARTFYALVEAGEADRRPIRDLFALLVMLNRVSRVASQAKNICEETLFIGTGETKQPKVYRVLFVDHDGTGPAQLASAFGTRALPRLGTVRSRRSRAGGRAA